MTEIDADKSLVEQARTILDYHLRYQDGLSRRQFHTCAHAAVVEALSAQASRVAELEGALKTIRASAEQSGDWPPQRRDAALEGILKVASKALGREGL